MEGVIHVIEQLGAAHKAALAVIEQQAGYIRELESQIEGMKLSDRADVSDTTGN